MSSIKPAVVAIVLFAAYRIGARTLKNKLLWGLAITSFVAITLLHWPFPIIILLAAIIGGFTNHFYPKVFNIHVGHLPKTDTASKALIDDDTQIPSHAIFNLKKFMIYLMLGLLIWMLAMAVLTLTFGWDAVYTKMAWFFTKAALLTFGGAYAVLPYVYQGTVEHYQWLTSAQMMDGLALGETTPGPLIMIVTFVGFLGGWSHGLMQNPFISALLAASIVTFFTFLPSFIFILMGAPLIESTKSNLKMTAPLSAISAAVVGVIVALALFFAIHVFWPDQNQQPHWGAMLSSVLGFIALGRWKLSVIQLLGVFAIVGLIYSFLI